MAWVLEENADPPKQGPFVLLLEADSMVEAELVKGVLIQHHLAVMTMPSGNIYLPRGSVWVLETQRESALQLARELEET